MYVGMRGPLELCQMTAATVFMSAYECTHQQHRKIERGYLAGLHLHESAAILFCDHRVQPGPDVKQRDPRPITLTEYFLYPEISRVSVQYSIYIRSTLLIPSNTSCVECSCSLRERRLRVRAKISSHFGESPNVPMQQHSDLVRRGFLLRPCDTAYHQRGESPCRFARRHLLSQSSRHSP